MSRALPWLLASTVVVAGASCALGESVTTEHGFRSRFLSQARDLVVFLPPGHDRDPSRRYPVLYMHDGQSVFTATPPGALATKWRMDETAARLIAAGRIEPLIIVGIPNRPEDRTDELTPTRRLPEGEGGKGDLYGRMLVEEIKPFIDSRYRTRPGPADTGLCGASLGGLITLHLGLKYPAIFGKLCVMSPTISWDRWVVLREVEALPAPRPLRI